MIPSEEQKKRSSPYSLVDSRNFIVFVFACPEFCFLRKHFWRPYILVLAPLLRWRPGTYVPYRPPLVTPLRLTEQALQIFE